MKKKSKTKTALDYFTGGGFKKGQQIHFLSDVHMKQLQLHYTRASQPGKSESIIVFDEWNHFFSVENILPFDLRIEKHKTYNGYTVAYYHHNLRRFDLCHNNTYALADMAESEFMEYIKKEFNAVQKNHAKAFFRTEDDAQKAIDWVEALKLAHKMKEALAQ